MPSLALQTDSDPNEKTSKWLKLWAEIFIRFTTKYFRRRYTALGFVFLFLITALENFNDFDVGGDYILAAAAFLVATFAFSITMTMQKVYLFVGLATLIMLLPPMALFVSAEVVFFTQ